MRPILTYLVRSIIRGRINQLMILGAPLLALVMTLWMGSNSDLQGQLRTSLSMSFIVQLFGIYMALAGTVVAMRGNSSLLWLFDRGYRKSTLIAAFLFSGFPIAFLQSFFVIVALWLVGFIPHQVFAAAIFGALIQSICVASAGIFVGTISRDVVVLQWVSLPLLLLGALAINLAGALDYLITAAIPFGAGMAITQGARESSAALMASGVFASVFWTLGFVFSSSKFWEWSNRAK